jgi:UV DNA damage endonuclease
MNLGYACINTQLGKKKILGGRTCRKATFQQQGLRYVGDLAFQNLNDIRTIIEWNIANDIYLYRMPSDIFPWMSEYEFEDLPQYANICAIAQSIGRLATEHNVRLTFHPGPFNILASNKPDVVKRTMKELRQHSQIFDLMGFEPSHYNSINIHIGAAYKDKYAVLNKWCENYEKLDENTRKRLTIENDDKPSLYTTSDLYTSVHSVVGIPLVFDYHHHTCHPGDLSHREALGIAVSTWPKEITPVVHYSSARQIEDPKAKIQAHADYVYEQIDTYGYDVDIELEVKQKEKALLQYRQKYSILV